MSVPYTAKTIIFEKQQLGEWQRADSGVKRNMTEEAMFREIAKLVNDGWGPVRTEGITHIQMIEIIKR